MPRTRPTSRPGCSARTRAGALTAAVVVLTGTAVATTSASATAAPVAAGRAAPAAVDPSSRASVRTAYQNVWVPAVRTPTGWTGSTSPCAAGTDTAAAQSATLAAVNFARQLTGRPVVTMNATLSARAIQSALIQDASNTLNHTPPSSSACWTQTGYDASGKSNLFLAFDTVSAGDPVESYLDDPGPGNTFAGHRRWLLYSRLAQIGSGTTARANALYVIDSGSFLPQPAGSKVAAWPSAGFFPAGLEPAGRWSVSIPGADFGSATVTVKKGSKVLPTTITSRADTGYGDNTLVWNVAPKYDISQGDKGFTVSVKNYKIGGVAKSTTYTTTLFDATVGMAGRNVISFPWPKAQKVGTTFDPGATDNNGLPIYYYAETPDTCRANFNPSTVTVLKAGTCSVMAYVGHDARFPDAPSETRSFTTTA